MKNVKKILAFTMAMLMALSCFAALAMGVYADDEPVEGEGTETPAPDLSVQWAFDFTKYNEDVTALFAPNQATVTPLANSGYVTINGDTAEATNDSYVRFTENPTVEPAKLAYAVIKYRANPGDATLCMFANTKDDANAEKAGWGDNMVTGTLVRDGSWHTTVVDTTKWAVEGGTKVTDIRMDIGENMAGSVFDLAYIKFFASAEGAQACVAAEQISETISGEYNEGDAKIVKIGDDYYSANVIINLTAKEGAEGVYVDADGAEYTVRNGYVIDANGKDTGLTLVTADNGIFAYSAYAFYPLTYLTPEEAAIEIDGEKYAYGSKVNAVANKMPVAPEGATAGTRPTNTPFGGTVATDTIKVNGEAYVVEGIGVINGLVSNYQAVYGSVVYDTAKTFESIGFRGWAFDAAAVPDAFGYIINDGQPVWDDSFLVVDSALYPHMPGGNENVRRYDIKIPTAELGEGVYAITLLVKYGENVYTINNDGGSPNQWGELTFVKGGSEKVVSYSVGADVYTFDGEGALMKNGEAAPADVKLVTGDTNVLYIGLAELSDDSTGKYTYTADLNYVKVPAIPYNPATITPVYLYDGADMATTGAGMTSEYNKEEGFVTYTTTTPGDPNAGAPLIGETVGRYMVVKYRTIDAVSDSFFFSTKGGITGNSTVPVTFVADGNWNYTIVDLAITSDFVEGQPLLGTRFDMIASGSLDVAFFAFFSDELAAQTYVDEELWTIPVYHTATFKADGEVVKEVEFREGATTVPAPTVPKKDGYDGKWAEYTLGTEDIVIEAVYTEKVVEPEDTNAPEDTGDTEDTGAVDTGAADTGAADTEAGADDTEAVDGTEAGTSAEAGTTADTTDAGDDGCASVVGMGAVAVLMAAVAAAVVLKKKED